MRECRFERHAVSLCIYRGPRVTAHVLAAVNTVQVACVKSTKKAKGSVAPSQVRDALQQQVAALEAAHEKAAE